MSNDLVLACYNVSRTYQDGKLKVDVIQNLDLEVKPGESVSIVGASGSGKSTLLHIMGGLDTPSSGEVRLMGQPLKDVSQKDLGLLRNQHLGFVYQFHHLLPEFTALENVKMPLLIGKVNKAEAEKRAIEMLEKVGLGSRIDHRPSELSGGERQRAAIARALVTKPKCLLADEPTGNLDRKNAQVILDLMLDLQRELGTALVVVTHDEELAARFGRMLTMREGHLMPSSLGTAQLEAFSGRLWTAFHCGRQKPPVWLWQRWPPMWWARLSQCCHACFKPWPMATVALPWPSTNKRAYTGPNPSWVGHSKRLRP